MGSGTTIGEALKLGARAIGRDINPVAYFAVKNALGVHPRQQVMETFRAIEQDVAPAVRKFYQAHLPRGGTAEVLYYFWVKIVPCPRCGQPVDLFSSYVFAEHAYPAKNPKAQALCPYCGVINTVRYDVEKVTCTDCRMVFDPQVGPAKGAKAGCPACGHSFVIVKAVRAHGKPPDHRLYAKLVLRADGSKVYLPADDHDRVLYDRASQALKKRKNAYPVVPIGPGYNTDQVLNYCYRYWHEMFNDRQLLCLSLLADRIRAIRDKRLRDLFTCLFSGTLEFNNMFASFKGEGTGAVRHMFSHHILKPERIPLDANVWGTPKSSGAFSTLFESRLLRAFDYCENPFELRVATKNGKVIGEKVYGLSSSLGHDVAETFAEFREGKLVYLSCGDSANIDIAPESVDAVITDPPFFDNVHYSQLADFFYVWQRHILGDNGHNATHSTRSAAEVQTSDPAVFAERLRGIWAGCHRVLRPEGLLVFTYHHSKPEGWRCILEALVRAGFGITATHPIKAEMSVAQPKHQAKEPIDLDVILVCRKRTVRKRELPRLVEIIPDSIIEAEEQVARLNRVGRRLSRNDVRVILMAQIIKRLSWHSSLADSLHYLDSHRATMEGAIEEVYDRQKVVERAISTAKTQFELW
jgi:adenine-specific DNA methylase